MSKHTLQLHATETSNAKILLLMDTSIYGGILAASNPLLEITPPGFSHAVPISVSTGFSVVLTTCDLELQTENCGTEAQNLPDGIYVIKYSVSPNDVVYVEYNHFKMSKLLTRYEKLLCELDLGPCTQDRETKKKTDLLAEIRLYLSAAKVKAEICHEPEKAMSLYTYAKTLLEKLECTTC